MIEPTPIFICERGELSTLQRKSGKRQVKRIVQLKRGGVDGALTDCSVLVCYFFCFVLFYFFPLGNKYFHRTTMFDVWRIFLRFGACVGRDV